MTRSPAKRSIQQAWSSVRFMIGFHRDAAGTKRDKARVWSPPDGNATIREDTSDAEVFCHIASGNDDKDMDVQIKMHPDKIVLRRSSEDYWRGIVVSEYDVQVRVGDTWIKVGHDGSVTRENDMDRTFIDNDGSVFKETLFSTAKMSADGTELSSSTATQVALITPEGAMHASVDAEDD